MSLLIRPAKHNDINYIIRLSVEATRLMHKISPAGFGETLISPINRKKEKSWLIKSLKDKQKVIFVAEQNKKIVGYIMGIIENHPDDLLSSPYITVQYLCVDKKNRRSGMGKALMREIEKWAFQQGIFTLELIVYDKNKPARSLFQKLRYLPLEVRMAKKLKR